ncbi:MAG TPA: HAMP domain-containing sensor histidine kinase [Bacillales bacterium]|nr:HAMP domain-containing sensor histidine kinase [Bacillales bacterium]
MKKAWHIAKHVLFFGAVFLTLCLCWSAAFFITAFIYNQIGERPMVFISQLINLALGFFIFGLVMFTVTRFFNPQKQQMAFLQSLNNALIQIAGGDFQVNVTVPDEHDNARGNPFGELAKNIRHMADELNEIERMRQEFVSNVSHEIQSPLTSISGFARALQNEELTGEEREHYLDIIEMESKRLSKLSDNLLKLTSLESEHHPFEPMEYRLDMQIRNIVLSCEPQWVEKSIDMDISLDAIMVRADKDLMNQVWINLLANAIKFTPDGGEIGVRLSGKENQIIVGISDTGIGMDEEEKQHIFERFYKADKSRNRAIGGSGLGLSIVKKIIDMHNGEIQVESNRGKGTNIKVTLPTFI